MLLHLLFFSAAVHALVADAGVSIEKDRKELENIIKNLGYKTQLQKLFASTNSGVQSQKANVAHSTGGASASAKKNSSDAESSKQASPITAASSKSKASSAASSTQSSTANSKTEKASKENSEVSSSAAKTTKATEAPENIQTKANSHTSNSTEKVSARSDQKSAGSAESSKNKSSADLQNDLIELAKRNHAEKTGPTAPISKKKPMPSSEEDKEIEASEAEKKSTEKASKKNSTAGPTSSKPVDSSSSQKKTSLAANTSESASTTSSPSNGADAGDENGGANKKSGTSSNSSTVAPLQKNVNNASNASDANSTSSASPSTRQIVSKTAQENIKSVGSLDETETDCKNSLDKEACLERKFQASIEEALSSIESIGVYLKIICKNSKKTCKRIFKEIKKLYKYKPKKNRTFEKNAKNVALEESKKAYQIAEQELHIDNADFIKKLEKDSNNAALQVAYDGVRQSPPTVNKKRMLKSIKADAAKASQTAIKTMYAAYTPPQDVKLARKQVQKIVDTLIA